jgi:hypothetical protein
MRDVEDLIDAAVNDSANIDDDSNFEAFSTAKKEGFIDSGHCSASTQVPDSGCSLQSTDVKTKDTTENFKSSKFSESCKRAWLD